MRQTLSAATLAKVRPGDVLWDADVHGLQVRAGVTKSTYYLFYRTRDGRQRHPKLADTAVLTLTQARIRAKEMLLAVATGGDPSGATQSARLAPTVQDLADRYMRDHGNALKSAAEIARNLQHDLLPPWGTRKVASITGDDVATLRRQMANRPIHFNRIRALVSKMFNLAETWRMRPRGSNPVIGIERYPEHKRRRYMTAVEAKAIAAALDAHEARDPAGVAFVRLLILTGARRGEIAAARWQWLEVNADGSGVIRLPDSKTGARDIYLAPAAVGIVQRLPRTSGTLTGILRPTKLWNTIRTDCGCPDLRLHDLRHSFASVALSLGLTLGQIGELLGHKSAQTTMRYAHLIEDGKRAAAGQTVAAITQRMEA